MYISDHAVQRYQERVENLPENEVREILEDIAINGKVQASRLSPFINGAKEVLISKNGVFLVVNIKPNGAKEVITCYGDATEAKWYKRQNRRDRKKYAFAR